MKAENQTIIDILLEAGANPNAHENEEIGNNTPMHNAAERNMIKVTEMFIDLGGDMTATNNRGFTCLHLACREGHTNMVKFLLSKGKFNNILITALFVGADENVRDKFGYTPSYWAHKEKFTEILAILPPPMKRTQQEIYDYMQ